MLRNLAKNIVMNVPFLRHKYRDRLLRKRRIEKYEDHLRFIDEAECVFWSGAVDNKLYVGLVKDAVFNFDENYISTRAYFPKYERFLRNNQIEYGYYDIYASDWMEKAKQFDVIIWHTASDPSTQKIALNKLYVLETLLKKKCLPSFGEIWSYEDKINAHYLYKAYGLPELPTFVSHSQKEATQFADTAEYPIISKLSTGSSSFGVEKIKSKEAAISLINRVFSNGGRKTYFPFERQKDYVYFQKFIDDATFDLRIITIGDKALGYYRYPNKGDFKASGAGNYEKKAIPYTALDLAFKVKDLFKSVCLATDFLYSNQENQYYIIESSIFIGVDTCVQLEVDGVPGYYQRTSPGEYQFREGKYWIQELTLKELLESSFKIQ